VEKNTLIDELVYTHSGSSIVPRSQGNMHVNVKGLSLFNVN